MVIYITGVSVPLVVVSTKITDSLLDGAGISLFLLCKFY